MERSGLGREAPLQLRQKQRQMGRKGEEVETTAWKERTNEKVMKR